MIAVKESNFIVKTKALGAINAISPGAVMPTHNIETIGAYDPSEEDAIAQEFEVTAKETNPEFDVTELTSALLKLRQR